MLSMGITLTPADFVEVTKEPSSVLMQFTLCYAMMPTLAFGLGKLFGLEAGLLAGMVLVGSINGGQASNLCTYIAKGNVALSVLMTTATTVGAILMTPFLCKTILGAVVPVDAAGIAKSTIQVSCRRGQGILNSFGVHFNTALSSNFLLSYIFRLFLLPLLLVCQRTSSSQS